MMGKLYSSICGSETITRQQKNISFGANTHRDGVSYNEHRQEKPLVKLDDFASLKTGECYTLLPLPAVRLSKMQIPEVRRKDKNPGFVYANDLENKNTDLLEDEQEHINTDNFDDNKLTDNHNNTVVNDWLPYQVPQTSKTQGEELIKQKNSRLYSKTNKKDLPDLDI